MTTEEQLSNLIRDEKETKALDLLRTLPVEERKALSPFLKKLGKYYHEFKERGNGRYESTGTEKQKEVLLLVAFCCLPQKDFTKDFFPTWMLEPVRFNKVKDMCPSWFNNYVNSLAKEEYISIWINYNWIMQLVDEGFVDPSKELLAKLLPQVIFVQEKKNNEMVWVSKPENLLKRPITTEEHIWYLFDVETNLHYSDRFLYFGKERKDVIGWISTFKMMVAEGKMERSRLLKESLLASNKNFNKVLSGWFIDLFAALEPTPEEIKNLQPELFSVLSSIHSKPVNESLQWLKSIAGEKDFDINTLQDALPAAMSSKTKATVTAALMLLEQVCKKHKTIHSKVAALCSQAFVHADDGLQTRAAKLIAKYGEHSDVPVPDLIEPYQSGLLQNARKLLEPFLHESTIKEADVVTAPVYDHTVSQEGEAVKSIDTIDELVFLAAQAFDNNDALHIDILPAALVNLQDELKGHMLSQLQPALQRALQLTKTGLRSTQGYYDHMLGIFFIDVCVHLVRKYPTDAADLNEVFEKFTQEDGNNTSKWMAIGVNELYMNGWTNYYKDPIYNPRKQWFIDVLQKIRAGDKTPLLSTPTHYPGFIDASKLVKRIAVYQDKGQLVNEMDLWFALGRCSLSDTGAAIELTKQILKDEWKELMLFLLEPDAEPTGKITQPEAWMMASLSKKIKKQYARLYTYGYYDERFVCYTGQLPWRSFTEEYQTDRYDYEKKRTIKVTETRKSLTIEKPKLTRKTEGTGIKGLLGKLKLTGKDKEKEKKPLLYDQYEIKSQFFSNEPQDIRRMLLMSPNNIEVLLPQVLSICVRYPGENDKRMMIATLQLLYETWDQQGEMAHLFLATSLIYPDKTTAYTAGEIWLKYGPSGKIDMKMLGRILGIHERVEYAPLKRLTDLIMQSLFRVSPEHNKLLEVMIENILPELPDAPIKNLKKLLEIYSELVSLNNSAITNPEVRARLKVWKENAGLAKIIEGLSPGASNY